MFGIHDLKLSSSSLLSCAAACTKDILWGLSGMKKTQLIWSPTQQNGYTAVSCVSSIHRLPTATCHLLATGLYLQYAGESVKDRAIRGSNYVWGGQIAPTDLSITPADIAIRTWVWWLRCYVMFICDNDGSLSSYSSYRAYSTANSWKQTENKCLHTPY